MVKPIRWTLLLLTRTRICLLCPSFCQLAYYYNTRRPDEWAFVWLSAFKSSSSSYQNSAKCIRIHVKWTHLWDGDDFCHHLHPPRRPQLYTIIHYKSIQSHYYTFILLYIYIYWMNPQTVDDVLFYMLWGCRVGGIEHKRCLWIFGKYTLLVL